MTSKPPRIQFCDILNIFIQTLQLKSYPYKQSTRSSLVEFQLEQSQLYCYKCLVFICLDILGFRIDQSNFKTNIFHLLGVEVTTASIIHLCLNKNTTHIKIMYSFSGAATTIYQYECLKPQKYFCSQFWKLEVQDRDTGKIGFF